MKYKLFVYGTLKEGYPYHIIISDCKKVGDAETVNMFTMVDLGPFPMVIDKPKTHTIKGELYEINDKVLTRLDTLEGYPIFYSRRKEQFIMINNGTQTNALIYLGVDIQKYKSEPVVKDGIWRNI